MRSTEPNRADRWPDDMTITVNTGSSALRFLLFVRSVWALSGTDVPDLGPVPDAGDSRRPETVDPRLLAGQWDAAWAEAIANLSTPREARPIDAETRAAYDRMSFEELSAIGDPSRSGVFATGVDQDAFAAWETSLRSRRRRSTTLAEQPERVNLDQLVPAWRSGLHTIVELPFEAEWSRRVSVTHLLISTDARWDRIAYARALVSAVE